VDDLAAVIDRPGCKSTTGVSRTTGAELGIKGGQVPELSLGEALDDIQF